MQHLKKITCLIFGHKWTSNAEQGIKPTQEQLESKTLDGFFDYARVYCKRCGKEMPQSVEFREKYRGK